MHIPNADTQNCPFVSNKKWLKRLDTQPNESTNKKSTKLLNQRIRKRYYKTLGSSEINSPA